MAIPTWRGRAERLAATAWAPLAVSVGAYFMIAALTPDAVTNPDTLRDLLMARDCAEQDHCVSQGAPAGLGGFQQASSWIRLLTLAARAHLGPSAVQRVSWAMTALAAGVVFSAARRRSSAGPASFVALLFAWSAMRLAPLSVLHNPSLLPLPAAFACAFSLRMAEKRRVIDAVAVAVSIAFSVELHGIAALLVVPFTLTVGLLQRRPLASLAASAGWMVAVLWNLSRRAFESNLELALGSSRLVAGGAGLAALFAAALLFRRRLTSGHPRTLLALALLPAFLFPALVLALVRAFHEDLLPYYFVPALPFLAVTSAVALARARRAARASRIVLGLELILLVLIASYEIRGLENRAAKGAVAVPPLADMRDLSRALARRGFDYQDAFTRLQAPSREVFVAALAAFEPESRVGDARPGPTLNLFVVPTGELPPRVETIAFDRGAAAIIPVDSWLDRSHLTVCSSPPAEAGAERCVQVEVAPADEARDRRLELSSRAYPRIEAVERAVTRGSLREWPATQTRLIFRIDARAGAARRVALVPHENVMPGCQWQITRVTGVAHESGRPGLEVRLEYGGEREGSLELTRGMSGQCRDGVARLPPALYELAVDDPTGNRLLDQVSR